MRWTNSNEAKLVNKDSPHLTQYLPGEGKVRGREA